MKNGFKKTKKVKVHEKFRYTSELMKLKQIISIEHKNGKLQLHDLFITSHVFFLRSAT